MNTLEDALKKALHTTNSKREDYSTFVWKGEKKKDGKKYVQDSEKIMDMSPERLKECWKHCEKMLNNDDPKHLGRYNVLNEITKQITKCNTELFLRYCENSYLRRENVIPVTRSRMYVNVRSFISNSEEAAKKANTSLNWDEISARFLGENFPAEFEGVSINNVLDGCLDELGTLDKQHLTMTFITKMGLWFTKAEENELKASSNIERLKVAKEKLYLPTELVLKLSEKGLSYHEMRAMLTLPKKQKYSDMTTEQLTTLRNKVLLRLSREIDGHIFSWRKLQKQIELVAKYKGINLKNYD